LPAVHKTLHIGTEAAELIADFEESLRIIDGGMDFQPIAYEVGIAQQFMHLFVIISGDDSRIECIKSAAVVLAFFQYGVSAKARLSCFQR